MVSQTSARMVVQWIVTSKCTADSGIDGRLSDLVPKGFLDSMVV